MVYVKLNVVVSIRAVFISSVEEGRKISIIESSQTTTVGFTRVKCILVCIGRRIATCQIQLRSIHVNGQFSQSEEYVTIMRGVCVGVLH